VARERCIRTLPRGGFRIGAETGDARPRRIESRGEEAAEPQFAHVSERALARAFDECGIAWQYEPHTFVLDHDDRGIVEACTPDFYLPELDVYIECTTMRQELTARKNRKYRKLRELFGVTVEIMYRRDFIRLARSLGIPELEQAALLNDATARGTGNTPRSASLPDD
jgi:hypothetical protein